MFTDDRDCIYQLVQHYGAEPQFWQRLLTFLIGLWRRDGRLSDTSNDGDQRKEHRSADKKDAPIMIEDIVAHMVKSMGPLKAFDTIMGSGEFAQLATVFPPVAYRHFIHAINVDIQHKELVYLMVL